MKKNARILSLIKLLSAYDEPVNSSVICDKLKIKSRTLREDLSQYKDFFAQNGIEIISRHRAGYAIRIADEDKYYTFMREMMEEETTNQCLIPEFPEERINYLIRLFLTADQYLKLEEIAESIFVSQSTLNNDLKEVRNRLKYFHLELDSKPYHGMKIKGDELHIRSCMAKYFFNTDTTDQQLMQQDIKDENQRKIREILYETLYENKLKLTDIGFQSLAVHISIALLRNSQPQEGETDAAVFKKLEKEKEYFIAQDLAHKLQKCFQVILPQVEIYYLTIHLLGKKTFDYGNRRNFVISEDLEILFDKIFSQLEKDYHIDFSTDFELYTLLALHFQPMLNRLQYKLPIENPMLDQIKEKNIMAFNMAVSAGMAIEEHTGLHVNENELGYMALHLALAYERKEQSIHKKNIIIICASGAGSSQILLYKIRQRFHDYLDKIYVTSLYELEETDQKEYDFILSTIAIPFATSIPVIQVQYFLTDKNFHQIDGALRKTTDSDMVDQYFRSELFFTDIEAKNRDDIIMQMCSRIRQELSLPENFEELIYQREEVSSTEFGNDVAFPHPIKPVSDQTFVAAAIMPKLVKWDKQYVKYIFLLSVSKKEKASLAQLYEVLIDLFCNSESMKLLDKNPVITTLKLLLEEIVNGNYAEKMSDDIFHS